MKQKILSFLLATLFGVFLTLETSGQVVKKQINVDGSMDDWNTIEQDTMGMPNGTDLSVFYKMAWDDEGLYLLFMIEDDTAAVYERGAYQGQPQYAVDNIELFFDMDNSDSVWSGSGGKNYDGINDMQLRFHRDTLIEVGESGFPGIYGNIPGLDNSPGYTSAVWGTSYQQGFAGMGANVFTKEVVDGTDTTGYMMEIGLPFSFLLKADPNMDASDFMTGSEIGFGIQVRDMDAVGEHMAIRSPDTLSWKDPSDWSTITLGDSYEPVTIHAMNKSIAVDGDASDWSDISAYTLGADNAPDLAVTYKLARDNQNLYVLFEVEDDTAAVLGRGDYASEGQWSVDNIELFLDMDNSKNVWESGGHVYDDNDYQLRFHRDTLVEVGASGFPNIYGTIPDLDNSPGYTSPTWGTDYQQGFAGLGVTIEMVETATGYMQEIAIPFDFLSKVDENLSPGDFLGETEVGVRIQVRDMDAVGEQMAIDYPLGSHWKKPNTWTNLVLEDASEVVTATKKIITVDGSSAEWNSIPGYDVGMDNGNDLTVDYKLAWDDENLYVLFEVLDDTAAVLGRGDYASEAQYLVDNIELFLDVDNSKNVWESGGPAYDDNDFQLRFHRDTLVEVGATGFPGIYGSIPDLDNSPGHTSPTWGTDYQQGFAGLGVTIVETKTDSSYAKEIAVPFSFLTKADANMSPMDFMAGSEIGLRIQIRDMDAVGVHTVSAFPDDSDRKKPLTWATIMLEEGSEPAGIMAATKSIIIDGDYADWSDVQGYDLGEDNSPDLAISYKFARDLDNLYMMYEIKDDTAAVLGRGDYASEGQWSVDNIELFLDMDNSKNVWESGGHVYDDNDYQLRFHRDTLVEVGADGFPNIYGIIPDLDNSPGYTSPTWGTDYQQGFAGLGVIIDYTETADGYMSEIAIPFEFLTAVDTNLSAGDFYLDKELGVRIQVRDMDAVGEQMAVDYPAGSHWKKPNTWGTLKLKSGYPSLVELDGVIDSKWDNATMFPIERTVDIAAHAPVMVSDADDLSGYFKMMYDEYSLYVLAVVEDDTLIGGTSGHNYDRVGLFWDAANDKGLVFGPTHMSTSLGVVNGNKTGRTGPGWGNPPYFEAATSISDTGFVVEYKLLKDSLGIDHLMEGVELGFDILLNDVDNEVAPNRDQMAWVDSYDLLWRDPYRFGTIELLADGMVAGYNTKPGDPDLTQDAITANSVDVSWTATTDAESYILFFDGVPVDTVTTTSATFTDLEPGTLYAVGIVAVSAESVWSVLEEISFINAETPVNISKYNKDALSVYPNPTTGEITLQGNGITEIQVFDVSGRSIYSETVDFVDVKSIDLSHLGSGLYKVKVTVNNETQLRTIIKK